MGINRDKPDLWKEDIERSVDLFNQWFMEFAPKAFRETRVQTIKDVESSLKATNYMINVNAEALRKKPEMLPTLRMCTCPPLARDRLIGLGNVPKSMVERMEKEQKLPVGITGSKLDEELSKIVAIIVKLTDPDIFTWLGTGEAPTESDLYRAATIVADRLCGAVADPIIRNAQEARQLKCIGQWLNSRGYTYLPPGSGVKFNEMKPATYTFRLNVPVSLEAVGEQTVNIPVDVIIMQKKAKVGDLPLLVEAKSAGDFTNVNKRRKEEAKKIEQLRRTYGDNTEYVLFLCGYFDSGYLGYEAAEGIDWVWEHRIDDFAKFGL